ncbi:hypothetical protein ABNM01_12070 [Pseudomonas syringae]
MPLPLRAVSGHQKVPALCVLLLYLHAALLHQQMLALCVLLLYLHAALLHQQVLALCVLLLYLHAALLHQQMLAACCALQCLPLSACPARATLWFGSTTAWIAKASDVRLVSEMRAR